jgi:hypothetical protein
LKGHQPIGGIGILGVHKLHPIAFFGKQGRELAGMGDVAGDHKPTSLGMAAANAFKPPPGIKQKPQGDAAAVAEANCPA